MMNSYYTYIVTNKKNGVLYVGVTDNLLRRVYEHKNNMLDGFTKRYNLHYLVYYEIIDDIKFAIKREKQMKKWNRDWKIRLIEKINPDWKDLYEELKN
jgi:putative endonuclease